MQMDGWMDGRTDMMELIVASHNFTKEPQKKKSIDYNQTISSIRSTGKYLNFQESVVSASHGVATCDSPKHCHRCRR